MTTVLIVDDSKTAREFLAHLLAGAGIEVVGTVANGREAVEFLKKTRPDVVTMDIHMPVMNGLEATRLIMETNPLPIVMVSGVWDPREVESTFRALEAGALALVRRPEGPGQPGHVESVAELVRMVKLMSEIKVVRRWARRPPSSANTAGQPGLAASVAPQAVKVVAIGASAGGPPVLQTILSAIPRNFPAPVLIVQHMAAGFLPGLQGWLAETSGLPLAIGVSGETARPGQAYLAPDGYHMGMENGRIVLVAGALEHGARPSVSYLFRSVAAAYGKNALGILLTGMGRDGADGLKTLRQMGAVTIAQNRETSAVYGMPQAAVELDAAEHVLAPEQIAGALQALANNK